MKLFSEMLDKKIVKLEKRTYSLQLVSRGLLNERTIKNKEVNLLLKEKTLENLDTLASLTMKVPYAEIVY